MLFELLFFMLAVFLTGFIYDYGVSKLRFIQNGTARRKKFSKWLAQGLLFIGLIVTAAMLGWID
ncbi:hypothetical protein [Bacillus ectoiniformans]|uniref:hypothetical protein n=1 Tax=Bacillus ectoiniformans TaxID=1494429 RepID=UPI00195E0F09|nr:hypothetical protein [Bacillus ectoiniformans]